MKRLAILAALGFATVALASATLHTAHGSGGTLVAPTALGQNIKVSNVPLISGGFASLTCPVSFFGAGTYQWNWKCSGGKLWVKGSMVATVSGSMKLTCSGGGHNSHTTCWHSFTGAAVASGGSGPINIIAKGGPNNGAGKVTSFSATW